MVLGNELWNKSNIGDYGSAVKVDIFEDLYVVGCIHNGVDWDYLSIKYDSNGNELWNATYDGGIGNDCVMDIFIDDQNYVYIVGYIFNGVNDDIYIIKYG